MTTLRNLFARIVEWSTRDWALKLTSLALAFLLWTTVRAEAPGTWEVDVEVEVVNYDGDWVVAEPPTPSEVTVRFQGPYRELPRTFSERPTLIVPVQQVNDTSEVFQLRAEWLRMPPGTGSTRVADDGFRPREVRLVFDRVSTRVIPVTVPLIGTPAPGYELIGPAVVEPSIVRASGALRDLSAVDTLRLPAVDLRDRRALDTLQMTIDTTGTGLIISPRTVRVVIPIRPILDTTTGGDAAPPRR